MIDRLDSWLTTEPDFHCPVCFMVLDGESDHTDDDCERFNKQYTEMCRTTDKYIDTWNSMEKVEDNR